MILCSHCGKDASGGWIVGFAPAPDSQKLGLCAEHDTPENRDAVCRAWEVAHTTAIVRAGASASQPRPGTAHTVIVHFSGGGRLSFSCRSCTPTPHNTLCIDSGHGHCTFIPLQHIRDYVVAETPANAPASPDSRE